MTTSINFAHLQIKQHHLNGDIFKGSNLNIKHRDEKQRGEKIWSGQVINVEWTDGWTDWFL